MILDRRGKRLGLRPGIVLENFRQDRAFRRIARRKIGLALALDRSRQKLQQKPAGAPIRGGARQTLGDGEPHEGRDLLRLAEILMRRFFEPLTFECDDALVARDIAALLDRQRQMAPAEKLSAGGRRGELRLIEPRKGAQPVRRIEINDDHVDDAVAARLQLQPAFRLQAPRREAR